VVKCRLRQRRTRRDDRPLLELNDALAAAVEEVQITFAAGCALHYSAVRPSSGYQDI
jgi:hypothetical protein